MKAKNRIVMDMIPAMLDKQFPPVAVLESLENPALDGDEEFYSTVEEAIQEYKNVLDLLDKIKRA